MSSTKPEIQKLIAMLPVEDRLTAVVSVW